MRQSHTALLLTNQPNIRKLDTASSELTSQGYANTSIPQSNLNRNNFLFSFLLILQIRSLRAAIHPKYAVS